MKIKPFIVSLFVFLFAHQADAHVGYVVSKEIMEKSNGTDTPFLLSVLNDPNNILAIIATLIIFFCLYFLAHHTHRFIIKRVHIIKTLESYTDLLPWILRLGLGIAFIGASMHQVLLSPLAPDTFGFAGGELLIGFLILSGTLLMPALFVGLIFFIFALFAEPYTFGNLDFLAGIITVLILANGRPGFDHIVGITSPKNENLKKYVPLILRLGLGSAFIFLAFYEKLFNPHFFTAVVSKFDLTHVISVSPAMWTLSVGLIELIVGIFILIGFHTRLTSAIAFIVVSTTFFFFKEDVYSHITIFSTLSALFILGGGHWSVDEYLSPLPKKSKAPRKIATRKRTKKLATVLTK